MPRKRASVRREEILSATVDEIVAVGSNSLRVADVAKRLGISASLIIYHFVTREALVAAAFTHAGENDLYKVRRIAAGTQSPTDRLWEVLEWYLPTGTHRTWRIWIDGWAAGMYNPQLEHSVTGLDHAWKQTIAQIIAQGVDAGEMRAENPADSAARITAFADGLVVQNVVRPGGLPDELLRTWTRDFVSAELGIKNP